MGKQPNDFVPVKYSSEGGAETNVTANLLLGGLFGLFLYQIYRSMHGRGGLKGPGKGTGASGDKG